MTTRILHCINSISSRAGGVGFAVQSLCEQLRGLDHVVMALRDDWPPHQIRNAEIQLFDRTGPFALSYSRGFEAALLAALRTEPDSVVHVHGLWSGMGHSVNVARRRIPGLPYVVSPHGMMSPDALQRRRTIKGVMRTLWEDAVISGARTLHCLTPAEESDVRQFAPHVRTVVVPHAVPFLMSEVELAASWTSRLDAPKTLLYLGRIHETKGITLLVDELTRRARAGRPAAFRLKIAGIGEPEALADLESRVADSPAAVEVLGGTFGAAKTDLMLSVHGIILPSRTEGLPMTLMEASAHALPLFVTRECNLDWVDTNGAGAVAPFGQAGIEALIDIFDATPTAELCQMGLRSADAARTRYSSEIVADSWRDLYSAIRRAA